MLTPQSISEQLLFVTLRLKTSNGLGTGFIMNFSSGSDKAIPVIVTNKHVVNNLKSENVQFHLHTGSNKIPLDENISLNYKSTWIFHPDDRIDLCCTPFGPIIHEIKANQSKEIFFSQISEDLIWDDENLEKLNVVEDILMVGYPIGLYDKKHNLPLIRRGITSSHPALDFDGKSVGLIDTACFPGSSGSPIFIVNDGGYSDKRGNTVMGPSDQSWIY